MAKKSPEQLALEKQGRDIAQAEKEALGDDFDHMMLMDIRKGNPFADVLSTSGTADLENADWISTGVMTLNAMISGYFDKGLPPRLLGLSGASKSGKTFILLAMMAAAQKRGYTVLFFDTEGALDVEQAKRHGIDTKKVIHIPIKYVNEWGRATTTMLERLQEKNTYICPISKKAILKPESERKKYFVGLDSMGNLTCLQDLKAMTDDKASMGTRAKEIRNVFRAITTPMAQLGVPMVFTNHIFMDPGDSNPSLYDKEGGGKGPEYMATVLIQFRPSFLYQFPNKKGSERGPVIGTKLTARCTKNRFVPALTETVIELTFDKGVRKYSGMVDKALEAGLFQMSSSWLVLSCGKKVYRSALDDEVEADKAFAPIMDKLQAYITEQSQYSSTTPADFEISEELPIEEVQQ